MNEFERPDNVSKKADKSQFKRWGVGVPLGIAIGAGIGAAMENIGVGIAIGFAVGIGLGFLGGVLQSRRN